MWVLEFRLVQNTSAAEPTLSAPFRSLPAASLLEVVRVKAPQQGGESQSGNTLVPVFLRWATPRSILVLVCRM